MKNVANRILAAVIAMSLVLAGISFPTSAAEANMEGGFENYGGTDKLDEFQEAVSELNEDISFDSDGRYATKRLIAISDDSGFDTCGAESVIAFDELHVLSYSTEQECADAYKNLSSNKLIQSVEIDAVMEAGNADWNSDEHSSADDEPIHQIETDLKRYLDEIQSDRNVKVAILDTGISEEFMESGLVDDLKINLSGSGEKDSVIDDNGHGTEMAEIILMNGGENTKVMPIKIADSEGRATVLNAYIGIMQAVENRADIINISLNAPKSPLSHLLTEAINDASEQGVSVIVSAGNDGIDTKTVTPANIDSAIVVSAVDRNNSLARYSNYGESVDYCSYGDYNEHSGTSYAAANVSGILARMISKGLEANRLDELTVELQGDQAHYGRGLVAYEYYKYDDKEESGEEEPAVGKNESIVAMMMYAAVDDESFDISNDFRNLEYDKGIYDVEYMFCTPDFDISKTGKYSVAYKFKNKINGSEQIISRVIKVTDNKEFAKDVNLSISTTDDHNQYGVDQSYVTQFDRKAIVKRSPKVYTAYSVDNDFPSVKLSDDYNLSVTYARVYVGLFALLNCAMAVEKTGSTVTWSSICGYGEDLYTMEYRTDQTVYTEDTTQEKGTVERFKKSRVGGCPVKMSDELRDTVATDDNILGCVIANELKQKYGSTLLKTDNDFKKIFSKKILSEMLGYDDALGYDAATGLTDGYLGVMMQSKKSNNAKTAMTNLMKGKIRRRITDFQMKNMPRLFIRYAISCMVEENNEHIEKMGKHTSLIHGSCLTKIIINMPGKDSFIQTL